MEKLSRKYTEFPMSPAPTQVGPPPLSTSRTRSTFVMSDEPAWTRQSLRAYSLQWSSLLGAYMLWLWTNANDIVGYVIIVSYRVVVLP